MHLSVRILPSIDLVYCFKFITDFLAAARMVALITIPNLLVCRTCVDIEKSGVRRHQSVEQQNK